MTRISSFELLAVDIPLRKAFKHSAAARTESSSLFVKCTTGGGVIGFGECLPRDYVTGETRQGSFRMLRDDLLPRLIGMEFDSMSGVGEFLARCDGKSPGWVPADVPQSAAWCAVDLALLDTFGRDFDQPALAAARSPLPDTFRYSGVLSAEKGVKTLLSAFRQRAFGLRQVKLKVGRIADIGVVRLLRRAFGERLDIRVDTNMGWTVTEALQAMPEMARYGVMSFEQPIAADDIEGLARLVSETGLDVMVDESFTDRASLEGLIQARACTAINLRVSKCGGLIASLARAREALDAGLWIQIGCQVGESSLLSAAHVILSQCVRQVRYAEGCFGLHLIREDPVQPLLQFGRGGRPPSLPDGPGLGVGVDEAVLIRYARESATIAPDG